MNREIIEDMIYEDLFRITDILNKKEKLDKLLFGTYRELQGHHALLDAINSPTKKYRKRKISKELLTGVSNV